ncbi:MAG TPA: ParB/RepB/Spo0J family partition protein [Rhodopila sp.]|jgi:ParB family chromosome partitioning protein|nr:ParB/RepB/Spo0J family partition protein [Rhodopila sp.]
MATAIQKITLSSSRDIPFNKLVLSQSNVRRVKVGVSIEELAEDIARRTLLQSLNVRPLLDAEGIETGMFEVPAGGRRYRALERLVKQKRLAKTAPVPCVVRDPTTDILAEDDSLAENVQRVPLHPLDQFRAFQAMREKGQTEEGIAAAFFTTATMVKQRLRLASVSPKLLDIYAEDGMSLEQLMAFSVTGDHARQEQVWQAVSSSWSKEPYQIRRMLTEKTVRASDRRAVFIGLDAYEAAGGVVMRDLFQQDDGGWLEDAALLDSLVTAKLKVEAEAVAAEGWKWVAVGIEFPYGHTYGLRELDGVRADLTDEERATIEALNTEYTKLEAEYENADELPDEVDQRLGEIETALSTFEGRPVTYTDAEITHAGVFVSIGAEGQLLVERGWVRPEDEPAVTEPGEEHDGDAIAALAASQPDASPIERRVAIITIGGQPAEPEDDDDDTIKALPDRLVMELTAHRTLALRNAMADNPHVALTALLHKLVGDTFRQMTSFGGCLEASVRQVSFPVQTPDLKDTPSARAIAERQEAWKADLPQDDQVRWDWLAGLDDASRLALLAHCVSFGVNALYEKPNPHSASGISQHALDRRLSQADRLAQAVGLDMVEAGWVPTADNYLNRVPKRRILEAVREGAGERAAQLIDHLKKGDMAKEAERLLDGSGWLPEPLRLLETEADASATDTADGEVEALPEFLASDDEASGDDADEPHAVAAE